MLTPNADTAGWKLTFQLAALMPPGNNIASLHVISEMQSTET